MQEQNLFLLEKKGEPFYWVQSKLIRESVPWYTTESLASPDKVVEMTREYLDLENCDKEYFIAIYLDKKIKVNAANIVSIGTLDNALVHPREVFKPALLCSAAAVILAHNHPSGDPKPSANDVEITKKLIEAGEIIGISIIDHVIIGQGRYVSLKEKGII